MWVVYLEMAVALALLILIVWFTWPKKKAGAARRDDAGADAGREGSDSRNR